MSENNNVLGILCPGCGEIYPDIEAPVHPYIGASAGCWKIYGETLTREFNNSQYFEIRRITVDAYSAQHPGTYSHRSAQSVNVHLVALYLILEKKLESRFVTKLMDQLIKCKKNRFEWLTPPKHPGEITLKNVFQAKNTQEHEKQVYLWGLSVFESWKEHYNTIKKLADFSLNS